MSRRRIDPTPPTTERKKSGGSRRATPTVHLPSGNSGPFSSSDRKLLAICIAATIAAGVFHNSNGPIVAFIVAGVALASLASLVGRCVEAIGDKLGPGATGVLQSFLANLPEIFVIMFALKAGLYDVVKATIVGSVLANVLLVAGLAYVVGGLKHGRQRFSEVASRQLGLMLLLSVSVLAIPTLTSTLHTPAAGHERAITVVISLLLLALFAASLPDILRTGAGPTTSSTEAMAARSETEHHGSWSLTLGISLLGVTAIASALVSDWFVSALSPAMDSLNINSTFAGLIIVAIAGNAVENVVGIQLCARNQPEYALQIILQSPVQVAMIVAPLIALAAPLVGAATFTLVLTPMLLAVLVIATLITVVVVEDGESTWFEGAALLALYIAIACAFWWG
jgi:Ca2+:H+ antiporter